MSGTSKDSDGSTTSPKAGGDLEDDLEDVVNSLGSGKNRPGAVLEYAGVAMILLVLISQCLLSLVNRELWPSTQVIAALIAGVVLALAGSLITSHNRAGVRHDAVKVFLNSAEARLELEKLRLRQKEMEAQSQQRSGQKPPYRR